MTRPAAELTREQVDAIDRVFETAARAQETRRAFEDAIRAAHPACTVRAIAEAAGLSSSRVHQIIQEGEAT